jgi:hypothetical protein
VVQVLLHIKAMVPSAVVAIAAALGWMAASFLFLLSPGVRFISPQATAIVPQACWSKLPLCHVGMPGTNRCLSLTTPTGRHTRQDASRRNSHKPQKDMHAN